MSLSDRERELLEQMERSFYAGEADVVDTAAPRRAANYRAIVGGVLLGLLGIGLLIAGASLQLLLLGVGGFAVMVAAVIVATLPGQKNAMPRQSGADNTEGIFRSRPRSGGSFSERISDRWERRMNGEL